MPFPLLRCLARAVAKNGVKFVCGLVARRRSALRDRQRRLARYRQAQQRTPAAPRSRRSPRRRPTQVRQEVQAAVRAEAADLPDEPAEAPRLSRPGAGA